MLEKTRILRWRKAPTMQQRQRINSLKRKVVDSRTENAIQFQSSLTHAYVCRCDAIARDARDNKETGLNRLSKTIIGAREIGHQDQIKTEPITGVPSPSDSFSHSPRPSSTPGKTHSADQENPPQRNKARNGIFGCFSPLEAVLDILYQVWIEVDPLIYNASRYGQCGVPVLITVTAEVVKENIFGGVNHWL